MKTRTEDAWYRQPAMLVVAGVLAATMTGSVAMLILAINTPDSLVVSDTEYQQIRDDLRVTSSRTESKDEQ